MSSVRRDSEREQLDAEQVGDTKTVRCGRKAYDGRVWLSYAFSADLPPLGPTHEFVGGLTAETGRAVACDRGDDGFNLVVSETVADFVDERVRTTLAKVLDEDCSFVVSEPNT